MKTEKLWINFVANEMITSRGNPLDVQEQTTAEPVCSPLLHTTM